MKRHWILVAVVCCLATGLLIGPTNAARAQEESPEYPKAQTITTYSYDPTWPDKPEDVSWGAVSGLDIDEEGNIYVFTRGEPPIQVYDRSGKYLRGFGGDVIESAHYLRIGPQGNIWAVDVGGHAVYKFSRQGDLLMTLGTPGEWGHDTNHFWKPTDVAVTPDGDIFVADGYGNARVAHFDSQGRFVKQWGRMGTAPGEFSLVHSIARDSQGRLYVADRNNARVQVFNEEGELLDVWADILVPWGIWIDKDDNIWICGSSPMTWGQGEEDVVGCPPKDQLVMRFDTTGRVRQLTTFPKGTDGEEQPGDLNWVHSVAIDAAGHLYLGDIIGQRAQRFLIQRPE